MHILAVEITFDLILAHAQFFAGPGSLPPPYAIRLGRVFDNLLDNALKFSPRGGVVSILISIEGDSAVVVVSDVGEGIPESDLPHVFERFRRGHNVEGRIPGSGIGLAGVHTIVELHRGTIAVHSEVGQVTTFTVRLPVTSPR